MAKNLYITPTVNLSGKSVIALGIMEMLRRDVRKVGFFRPIVDLHGNNTLDPDTELLLNYYKLPFEHEETHAFTFDEAQKLVQAGKQSDLMEGIMNKYQAMADKCDFVLCEGTDFEAGTSAFEFDINAEIASNLGAPVLVITSGNNKSLDKIFSEAQMAIQSFQAKGINPLGALINRVSVADIKTVQAGLSNFCKANNCLTYAVPEDPTLAKPTMTEIVKWFNAEILFGEEHLDQHVDNFIMGAMHIHNFINRIKDGSVVITPGDRSDLILTALLSNVSSTIPNIAGIILTGGLLPEPSVKRLIEGWTKSPIPIISVKESTFTTTQLLPSIHSKIHSSNKRKIASALNHFESNVNVEE
ncbi:MAG: AAA family ATPase, partial [SAR324 cluster bacterium]|nr:AAA family ATPase [SAR324 cluster bacterium]